MKLTAFHKKSSWTITCMHLIMNIHGNYQNVFQFILSKPTTWNAIKIDNLQQTSNEVNIRVIRKCKILGSM